MTIHHPGAPMTKGEDTRRAILSTAVHLSSELGLEGLSIGRLAKRAGMSKSGLYAHFGSKEDLQVGVLDAAAALFIDVVLAPAIKEPRGLPRVEALFELWLRWETEVLAGGCIFMHAAAEFDDRPGPVRAALTGHLKDMLGAVARAARVAVEEGHFRSDLDADQFAYAMWANFIAFQHYQRLLGDERARAHAEQAFRDLLRLSAAEQTEGPGQSQR